MSLKTEKRIAVAGAAVVGVAVVGFGLSHVFSGTSAPHQPTSPPISVTQPAPIQNPVTQPPVVNPPVVVDNQQQVLHDLEQSDLRGLHSHGFKVSQPSGPLAFGSTCNADGTTDGAGYQGANTAISYDVVKDDGRVGKACITHPAGHVVVKYNQAAATTQPTPQTFNPVPGLEAADRQGLANKGVYVQGQPLSYGSTCYSDGTTDNSGQHGANTAISYQITRNGQSGKACVAHTSTGNHVSLHMN
jgi:hypothetical protein